MGIDAPVRLKISENRLRNRIRLFVKHVGSQAGAAKSIGCSLSYLNDYLNGKRAAGGKILAAFNLKKVVMYEQRENSDELHR